MTSYQGGGEWGSPRGAYSRTGPAGIFGSWAKTGLVMAGLFALLLVFGRSIGGYRGMFLFGMFGVIFNLAAFWFSDRIALAVHRARPVAREEAPWLYEMVEELSRKAGIPTPTIHVIPSSSPNAFATGRSPSRAAVAVTEGVVEILDRRQLRGVLAHELGHVLNRDTLISTIAATVAGLVSSLASMVKWGFLLGGGSRDRENGGGMGALAMAIVAPILAMLLQLMVSRTREYGADQTGARLCGDPHALADALERLDRGVQLRPYEHAGPATAHLFIVNPLHGGALLRLLSTHPPIAERVARLRGMVV